MGNAGHHPIRRQAPATTADGPDPSITQWGDDIYIDEEYSILDDDAVVDFSGCYPRPSTEYLLTGDQFLDLASFQEARHADREREKRMEDRKFFAFTVRGRVFHPGGLDNPKIRGEARFELVPEPHNPVDPCAVAIDFRGRRIGYVHADYARWLHGYVRAANIHGYRCRVPGFIESSEGAWYAIRTFDIIHQMTGYSDIVQRITHVRRGMDDDIRATAGRPSYSQKAADAYWTYRNLDPDIFPDAPSPDLYRGLWHRAEILLKDDMAHDLARYRARRRADAESKKAMRQEERQARRINRDAEVIRLRESGLPISRIAKTVSLSEETVRRIVNGKTAGQAGYNHYSEQSQKERLERCRTALNLKKEGFSNANIAKTMGISPETVKILLRDARFCSSPGRYPSRYRDVLDAVAGSHSPAGDRDLRMLRAWGAEIPGHQTPTP